MNVSKPEQRTLHVLAQGGHTAFLRDASDKITRVECYNRDGYLLLGCTLAVFFRLKNEDLVHSRQSRPHRVSMAGLEAVRLQADNRRLSSFSIALAETRRGF